MQIKASLGRKADISVLRVAISVVLAVPIVLVIIPWITKPFVMAQVTGAEQGESYSYYQLVEAVREVSNSSPTVLVPEAVAQEEPETDEGPEQVGRYEGEALERREEPRSRIIIENFGLGGSNMIVGFWQTPRIYDSECVLFYGTYTIHKPVDFEECWPGPCICICDEDDLCVNPHDCREIPDPTFTQIVAETSIEENLGAHVEGYEELVLYGDCDGWAAGALGILDLLVEKVGNKIVISDRACHNYRRGVSECYNRASCPSGTSRIENYKCEEGWICCA